ncbi:ABC transporter ATP-binding protein [Marivivens marinus]|uniref:ABC transporter ATP-binding protein n=1 Tax=Marivivens marinus TaxID=3110173 RepID=UPI003B845985
MLLSIESLAKSFVGAEGPVPVLQGVSFDLAAGETVALTGESGSGKSTILHLVGGLDAPSGGSITIEGKDISGLGDDGRAALRRTTIGIVFQQFNLIPSMTVAANIGFQARLAGRIAPVAHLAARMGLGAQLDKYPEDLSGGQQQRVAIARALAADPRLILADEPTGNLDEATADSVMDLMLEAISDSGAGLLMVTHSDKLAARLSRRLHLSGGRIA